MSSSSAVARCPHCSADLPEREVREGWCDSCGKRLPSSIQQGLKSSQPARSPSASPTKPRSRLLLVGVVAALAAVLAAALIAWKAT